MIGLNYSLRKKVICSNISQQESFFIGRERTGRIVCEIVRIQGIDPDGGFSFEHRVYIGFRLRSAPVLHVRPVLHESFVKIKAANE